MLHRRSGILLPVFSLESRSDFGIGDFGCMEGFLSWMHEAGQRLLMVLPLLPTAHNDSSPYATQSAFGLNPLFIDISALPEFAENGGLDGLAPDERRMLDEARSAPRIRYDLVFPLKEAVLRRCFQTFHRRHWQANGDDARQLARYMEEQARWLGDYALFAALSKEHQFRGFWEWPAPLYHRYPEALREARTRLADEVLFHSWLQWTAERQWAAVRAKAHDKGILLCGDEPFIIGQNSADVWAHPTLLRRDARLGVPPDDFSATGQDWGLPYFDFTAMEREGYSWLRYRGQRSAAYFDLRRVDHAVGYFRQWLRDETAPTGHFVPGDEPAQQALGERNFRMLAEAAGTIAEDLGVIPKWVRETLTRLGLPGYRVLRWERDDGVYRNPHTFPALSVATTGTHDTSTLRQWWEGAEPWERENTCRAYPELAGLHPEPTLTPALHDALLRAALGSGSDLCLLPWQDVLGTNDRINLPGSLGNDNWTYRIGQPAHELLSDSRTRDAAAWLKRITQAAGRL